MGHARALLALESTDQQRVLAREIIDKSLSVRDVEREAKRVGRPERESNARTKEIDGERANIAAAESRLSKRLQAPVKIKFGRRGGSIEVGFSSNEDLSRLFDLLVRGAG
jgi:ParB family chromosome partitioning protein